MRWIKVAAIAAGVLIAFLVVSSVVGLLVEVAIAALVVATVVLAVKLAFSRRQVSRDRSWSELREPPSSGARPRRTRPARRAGSPGGAG